MGLYGLHFVTVPDREDNNGAGEVHARKEEDSGECHIHCHVQVEQ